MTKKMYLQTQCALKLFWILHWVLDLISIAENVSYCVNECLVELAERQKRLHWTNLIISFAGASPSHLTAVLAEHHVLNHCFHTDLQLVKTSFSNTTSSWISHLLHARAQPTLSRQPWSIYVLNLLKRKQTGEVRAGKCLFPRKLLLSIQCDFCDFFLKYLSVNPFNFLSWKQSVPLPVHYNLVSSQPFLFWIHTCTRIQKM